jgi:hypothetical protein
VEELSCYLTLKWVVRIVTTALQRVKLGTTGMQVTCLHCILANLLISCVMILCIKYIMIFFLLPLFNHMFKVLRENSANAVYLLVYITIHLLYLYLWILLIFMKISKLAPFTFLRCCMLVGYWLQYVVYTICKMYCRSNILIQINAVNVSEKRGSVCFCTEM